MTKLFGAGAGAGAGADVIPTDVVSAYATSATMNTTANVIMTMIGIGIDPYTVYGLPFGANNGRHSTNCHTINENFQRQ